MGNQSTKQIKKENKTVPSENLQWKIYTETFVEGSKQLPEDPEFPKELIDKSTSWDYACVSNDQSGTNVYYPGQNKTKMWIGSYKTLNPSDFICNLNFCDSLGVNALCNPFYNSYEPSNYNMNSHEYCDDETSEALPNCEFMSIFKNNKDMHGSPVEQTAINNSVSGNVLNHNSYQVFSSNQNSKKLHKPDLNNRMKEIARIDTEQQHKMNNLNYSLRDIDLNSSRYQNIPSVYGKYHNH